MQASKLITCILSLLIVSLLLSCKKKKSLNLSTIKIATVDYADIGGGRFHYRFTYDRYNNVDSIITVGGGTDTNTYSFAQFTYIGSSFTITDPNGFYYTVDANTNGQIIEVLKTDTLLMKYNGNEIAELDNKLPSNTYPFYIIDSTNYYWNNGDIAAYSKSGVVDSYYYDNGHSGQEGDALRIDQFITYGRSYTNTNHLPTKLSFLGAWREQYFYHFDGEGRISQLTKVINGGSSPNDTQTYAYTYY